MYNITLVLKLRKKKKEQRQPVLESFQKEIVHACVQGANTSKGCGYIYEFWYNMSQVA